MVYERSAVNTLSAVELDIGDTLRFVLYNGQVRILTVLATQARVVETNLKDTRVMEEHGGTVLHFSCEVLLDGQPLTLERYLCAQEGFCVPLVVNGMRLWLDAVREIFDYIEETHGPCAPNRAVRLAVQDAWDMPCPEPLHDWCPLPDNGIDVGENYAGDDCWMGGYLGASAHGGLDINHPTGTLLTVPLAVDFQCMETRIAQGNKNNRWCGVRKWPNGDVWLLQCAHMLRMLVPDYLPLRGGDRLAEAAGIHVGDFAHSHFVFHVLHGQERVMLDPWLLFWQMLEQRRQASGTLVAKMAPLSPGAAGEPITFHAQTSAPRCLWVFGDGCASAEAAPIHRYGQPGVYAVTLTVFDDKGWDSTTQCLTIGGAPGELPQLRAVADEVSFVPRRPAVCDVFGHPNRYPPHTVPLACPAEQDVTVGKRIVITGASGALSWRLANPALPITVEQVAADTLLVRANAHTLAWGQYQTLLIMDDGVNSTALNVVITAREPATPHVQIDDLDQDFTATPFFWVGHRFARWQQPKGYHGFYRTNGARAQAGECARFTPYVKPGTYRIQLHPQCAVYPGARYTVRVQAGGTAHAIRFSPDEGREIGTFPLAGYGMDYVQIEAEGAEGLVCVDAIVVEQTGAAVEKS